MKLSAILAPLLAAKVDPEVILDAVRAWEAEHEASEEQGKEKARARWRKWKAGQTAANADQRLQTTEAVGKQLVRERARGEDNLQTTEIAGKKKEEGSPPARSTRGTRLPADYAPDLSVATCEKLSVEDAAREASKFRDYFTAAPGQKGVKLDWDATWRNWCRRASEDRQRQRGPPSSVKPGSAVAALGRFLERQDDGRQGREGEADHAAAQRLSADDRQLRPAAGGFRPALNPFPD